VLHQALTESKHDAWIDWQDIPLTADWWEEIKTGIESSNSFVFVISPDSINSKVCGDEVDHAVANNKRLIPIVRREGYDRELVRPALNKPNWIFFREQDEFDAAFASLVQALDLDLEHVKTHTRLLTRAIEWEQKERRESLLLRGDDLDAAEAWLATNKEIDPHPTQLQRDYVASSRSTEDANQQATQILEAAATKGKRRALIGAVAMVVGLLVALIAGGFAYREISKAATTVAEAEEKVTDAEEKERLANENAIEAQGKLDQANEAVKVANEEVEAAKAELADIAEKSETEIRTAQERLQRAEQLTQQAQYEQELAQARQQQAEKEAQIAQDGTRLEIAGTAALRRFEVQETEGMLLALRTAHELNKIIEDNGIQQIEEYPAISPFLALQLILFTGQETRLEGHQGAVWKATFSADGQRIATYGEDDTIRVWDLQGNQLSLGHSQHKLEQIKLTSTGDYVLTSRQNGTVDLSDLSGNLLTSFQGHQGEIWQAELSPTDNFLITRGDDRTVRLWNLRGEQLTVLEDQQDFRLSPDGDKLLTNSSNGIILWDLQGNQLASFEGHSGPVRELEFSPDGSYIVTSETYGISRLWDLKGNELTTFDSNLESYDILQLLFSPDSNLILTSREDGFVRLWDLGNWEERGILRQKESIEGVDVARVSSFSPSSRRLVTSGFNGSVQFWDTGGSLLKTFEGHQGIVISIVFDPTGEHLVTTGGDGTVRLWDLEQSRLLRFANQQRPVWMNSILAFSSDRSLILARDQNRVIYLGDSHGNQLATFEDYQDSVWDAEFSPNNRYVAFHTNKAVHLYDLQGNKLAVIEDHHPSAYVMKFSLSSNHIVTAGGDGSITLWDLQENELMTFQGHEGRVTDVAFNPTGDKFATSGQDGFARLWNLQGNQLTAFDGHQGNVRAIAFSHRDQVITTLGDNGSIRLWDFQGNQLNPPNSFVGHQGEVWQLEFNSSGNKIVTSGEDGTTRIWTLRGQQIAQFSGSLRAQNFDWERFFISDLDILISHACDHLRSYLIQSNQVTDGDRALCGIPPRESTPDAGSLNSISHHPVFSTVAQMTSRVRRAISSL
jgi:WD40 repeat protein